MKARGKPKTMKKPMPFMKKSGKDMADPSHKSSKAMMDSPFHKKGKGKKGVGRLAGMAI
jgi:hypothetical protein